VTIILIILGITHRLEFFRQRAWENAPSSITSCNVSVLMAGIWRQQNISSV